MKNFLIGKTLIKLALLTTLARGAEPATVADRIRQIEEKVHAASGLVEEVPSLIDGQLLSLLVFKNTQRVELWKQDNGSHRFIKSYTLTAFSGGLGPKLQEGDLQIPEGVYEVELLNPNSQFHLSFRLNYPNAFDIAKAKTDGRISQAPSPQELANLGGDIYVHGKAASVGCVAVGDPAIEELFYLVAENGRANTTVIIAPCDLRRNSAPEQVQTITWYPDLCEQLRDALTAYPLMREIDAGITPTDAEIE